MKATFEGVTIAESDETVVVEGNHYFPADSIDLSYFTPNARETSCPWKGTAKYYDVTVNGQTEAAVAWYYPDPKDAAAEIRDHVAFYPKVNVSA